MYIEIKVIPGHTNSIPDDVVTNSMGVIRDDGVTSSNYYILLLKPSVNIYNFLTDELNFKIFDTSKGFRRHYVNTNHVDDTFEPLKDYEK